jgi:hypothetical protein
VRTRSETTWSDDMRRMEGTSGEDRVKGMKVFVVEARRFDKHKEPAFPSSL